MALALNNFMVTVFSKSITTDVTATADATYTGRRFLGLKPPYCLHVQTTNLGTAPSGTISIQVIMQDSDDGSTYTNITPSFANTAIAAAGNQAATINFSGYPKKYMRAVCTASAGTWAAGTSVKAWLSAGGRA